MELTDRDFELVAAAQAVVDAYGDDPRHTLGAALLTGDGVLFTGVNVFAQGGGADAELVVLSKAISEGSTSFATIVAVGDGCRGVIPPCGVCRQLLLDYAPGISVITQLDGAVQKVAIATLLPHARPSWFARDLA
jgi:cytidine deaminase